MLKLLLPLFTRILTVTLLLIYERILTPAPPSFDAPTERRSTMSILCLFASGHPHDGQYPPQTERRPERLVGGLGNLWNAPRNTSRRGRP